MKIKRFDGTDEIDESDAIDGTGGTLVGKRREKSQVLEKGFYLCRIQGNVGE